MTKRLARRPPVFVSKMKRGSISDALTRILSNPAARDPLIREGSRLLHTIADRLDDIATIERLSRRGVPMRVEIFPLTFDLLVLEPGKKGETYSQRVTAPACVGRINVDAIGTSGADLTLRVRLNWIETPREGAIGMLWSGDRVGVSFTNESDETVTISVVAIAERAQGGR